MFRTYWRSGAPAAVDRAWWKPEHPEDYGGIWTNSSAINWTKFLIGGFWPMAVANSHHAPLKYHKLNAFAKAVHDSVGGKEKYYRLSERVEIEELEANTGSIYEKLYIVGGGPKKCFSQPPDGRSNR